MHIWFEIPIARQEISLEFYRMVFGWTLKPFADAPEASRKLLWHVYPTAESAEPVGGLFVAPDHAGKNGIEIYLVVENVAKILALAQQKLGSIDLDRVKRPDGEGYYARLIDPDGNIIGVWSPI